MKRLTSISDLAGDFRFALRMLRKRPAFAAVAITVLAFGIGATSAVFSMVHALLIRPFPFPEIERLVDIRSVNPKRPATPMGVTPADYLDWKERSKSFEQLAAYTLRDYDLGGDGSNPAALRGVQITADMLPMLRAKPAIGRAFGSHEDQPGHEQVVILSDNLWRSRYASDASILGRTILLDSKPFAVIGVMQRGFDFPFPGAALWTPLPLTAANRSNRRDRFLTVVARLHAGVSLEQARSEMQVQAQRLAREYPETNSDRGANIVLLGEQQGEYSKPFLSLLQATALFVLLIACANLANLQLAHAIARRREIAVRAALGAGRWRVIRLLLIESILIALAGGGAAIAVAYGGVAVLKMSVAPQTSRYIAGWNHVAVHAPVLMFTLLVAVACGITFGLSSAFQASRVNLTDALKQGGQQGGSKSRLRSLLVAAEVMLAVVAVTGASQMVRGFQSMFDVYQGFVPDRILAVRVTLPANRYDSQHKMTAFYDQARAQMASIPEVEASIVSSNLPGALRFNYSGGMQIEDKPALSHADIPIAEVQFIGPGYFEGMKIPLRGGRPIAEQDIDSAPAVAVVSQRLAQRYWPGESPIGKRVRFEGIGVGGWRTVVGVAADVNQFWFQQEPRPLLYLPVSQALRHSVYLAVRTKGDPMAILPAVRERIARLDAALPLQEPRPMREVMQETLSGLNLTTGMMMAFGVLALALAAIGVYGVMAYSVTQRRREFGIRLALGAQPANVLQMVVRQGLSLAIWGCIFGLAAGFAVSRVMSGIMFGLDSDDFLVLAGGPTLLAVVSLIASWLPARAVTQVDPVRVLRQE